MKDLKHLFKLLVCMAIMMLGILQMSAQSRRPIDNKHPMWLVHVDVWNNADPQKIIDLIPEDIKPYVCINLSLSCSYDTTLKRYKKPQNAIQTYRSWASVCCRNNMFFMCQPASGGHTHIPDNAANFDKALEIHEQFFKDYPNFLGWNYAEQFWGFNEPNDASSSSDVDRIKLFAKLVPMHHKYGGVLTISFCGNIWSHPLNPIGMMKRNNDFLNACKAYPEAMLFLYKYTTSANWYNNESVTIGPFISGLAKNYGVRYDNCGWNGAIDELCKNDGKPQSYPGAVGIAPVMEQTALNGACVWDGPELIWTECFQGRSNTNVNGYTRRNWGTYGNFDKIWVDMFRKIIDGTIHIPSRDEVIARTKIVMKNDVSAAQDNTGLKIHAYAAPVDLYHGLYWQDDPFNARVSNEAGFGNVAGYANNNFLYYKKTGRYATIPIVIDYFDDKAKNAGFYTMLRSDYNSNKNNLHDGKVSGFNTLYPEISTGDLFVARHKNALVCYYPFSDRKQENGVDKTSAYGKIPLQYNTCSNLELTFAVFSSGHVKEYSDHLDFYLNNYRNDISGWNKTDVIKVTGASSKPSYQVVSNRCNANVTESWSNGVYTCSVTHNGPIDLRINCKGTNSRGNLARVDDSAISASSMPKPNANDLKNQPLTIEGEDFDYKSITSCVVDAYSDPSYRNVIGHAGMGFMRMGTNTQGSLRYEGKMIRTANHKVEIKYLAKEAGRLNVNINGTAKSLSYSANASSYDYQDNWKTISLEASLSATNNNTIIITNEGGKDLLIDNVKFTPTDNGSSTPEVEIPAESENKVGQEYGNASYDAVSGKYYFYTPTYSAFEFNCFNGKKVADYAALSIQCGKESTVGYRLDIRLKKSNGEYFSESINGLDVGSHYQIGNEASGTRSANPVINGTYNLSAILKDYLAIDPNCTFETIRLNTAIPAADENREGKYFITIGDIKLLNAVQASVAKDGIDLYDLQMYNYDNGAKTAVEPEKKVLDGTTAYSGGTEIYGINGTVYYLNYTDLSEYKKMYIEGEGTLRVLLNRKVNEGSVADGNLIEIVPKFENGYTIIDLSQYPYAHLHSIKVGYGDPAKISAIKLFDKKEETVTPEEPEQPSTGGETTEPEQPSTGGETTEPEQPSTGGETTEPEQPSTGDETANNDTDISSLSNILYVEKTNVAAGSTHKFALKMKNNFAVTGFQCDIYLPEGMSFVKDADDNYSAALSTTRTTVAKTNLFGCHVQSDGSLRILCNSGKGYAFSGNDGEVATFDVAIAGNVKDGNYPLLIKNMEQTDATGFKVVRNSLCQSTISVSSFIIGDINNDGTMSISDFSALAYYILNNGATNINSKAADINGDGEITVSDLSAFSYLLLNGGTSSAKSRKVMMNNTAAPCLISISDMEIVPGGETTATISISNPDVKFSSYQFDLILPLGLTVKTDEDGFLASELSLERTNMRKTNFFDSKMIDNGVLRVLCASTNNSAFSGTEGSVAHITLVADKNMPAGTYSIGLDKAELTLNGDRTIPEIASAKIAVAAPTNIAEAFKSGESLDVYSVQGYKVLSAADADKVKTLPRGLYVINGKTFVK